MRIEPLSKIEEKFSDLSKIVERNIWKQWFFVTSTVTFTLLFLFFIFIFGYQKIYAEKFYPGVYVGAINLGGYTPNEAHDLLLKLLEKPQREGILFIAAAEHGYKEARINSLLVAPEDPDLTTEIFSFNLDSSLNRAWQLGRYGGLFNRVKEQLFLILFSYQVKADYFLRSEEVRRVLEQNFSFLENPAGNARLEIENHRVVVIPETYGNSFNYEEAIAELSRRLANLDFNAPIELRLSADYPKIKARDTLLLVAKAEMILERFNTEPIVVKYQDKEWLVNRDKIEKWLNLTAKDKNEVMISLDQASTTAFLGQIAEVINIEPKDALFTMATSSGGLLRAREFQASQDGLELDREASYQKLVMAVVSGQPREVELATKAVLAKRTTERVNELGIKELLGLGESNFVGSPKNRRHNIKVGADKLNGTIIAPSEEFSLVKALGETDAKAGYLPELVIRDNKTTPEYGGGLCQIGTTMFRAALYSGLPITERKPHSYRVSYYEPAGMDATIYSPSPDLKFINDTDHYLLLATEIEGDILRFRLYGTSDKRKVEIENPPRIWNIKHPAPMKLVETLDLKPGEKKCTEKAHNGADTEFARKVTYADSRPPIDEKWFSRYRPWQAVCLVGVEELSNSSSTEEIIVE